MHPYRAVVLAGAMFAGLALFLPFVTLPVVGAVDGVAGEAWPALIPIVPVVVRAVIGDWSRGNAPLSATAAIVLSCLGALFAVLKLIDARAAADGIDGGSLGPGAPVLIAAMAVVAVGATMSLRRS